MIVDTSTIDVDQLRDDAVDVQSVTVDGWSETYGETWDYVEAPSCPECSEYAVWNADAYRWECGNSECDDPPADGIDADGSNGAEGPMMNYHYPLPSLGDADDEYDAAERIRDLPLCLIVWQDGRGAEPWSDESAYSLALTGGGMDFSWEICEAFMRLGFLPPSRFAALPGMAGHPQNADQRQVIRAAVRSLREAARQHARRAVGFDADADRLEERYADAIGKG